MKSTYRSKTLALTVACDATTVFNFVANPENLARWNRAFCRSLQRDGDGWRMETARGRVSLRFLRDDRAGILDQVISWPDGLEQLVPLRVIPNGAGSEVLMTVQQIPGLPDSDFQKQLSRADQGLRDLKRSLEEERRHPSEPLEAERPQAEAGSDADQPGPARPTEVPESAMSSTAAEAEAAGRRLFVGNLPFDWTEEQLRTAFTDAGPVSVAEIAKFRRNGRSRGFGFVEMTTEGGAQAAIEKLHGGPAGSRKMTVRLSRPRNGRPEGSRPEPAPVAEPFPEASPETTPEAPAPAEPQRREVRGRFTRGPRRNHAQEPGIITTGEYEYFPRGASGDATQPMPEAPAARGASTEASPYFEDTGDVENRGNRRPPPRRGRGGPRRGPSRPRGRRPT
jgi:RNA recognition motif-containing protein